MEQHAERLGLDAERLEGARVAAARASPLVRALCVAMRAYVYMCLSCRAVSRR